MASTPILDKLERDIAARGGEEYIFNAIADGRGIGQIADEFGLSRRMMYRWRDHAPHKARRDELWAEAMRLQGEAQAERGLEDLEAIDGETASSAQVQLANSTSKYRQWLASKRDPEQFGDKGLGITFNLGDLHLQAIQRPAATLPATADEEIEEADVVMVEEGSPDEGSESQALELAPPPSNHADDELAELFDA